MLSPTLLLLVLALYVALLYGVAGWVARKNREGSFYSASRSVPWLWVAVGMIGAPMSGVSFISVPGSVATDSFGYLQMVAGFTLGQLVIAGVLLPLFYRLRVVSLYEYLEERFGSESHRVGALLFLSSKLILSAFKLLAATIVLQQLIYAPLGVPLGVNVLINVAIVWGYTRRGGVRSVVWTDILQTLCLVGAVVGTLFAIASASEVGVGELILTTWQRPESQILFGGSSPQAWWRMGMGGFLILIAMTGLDQDMMQRNLSCRTLRGAQQNVLLTALCQALVIALLLTLGGVMIHLASWRGVEASGDQLFGAVALYGGLPLWVGILFLLGLVSSTYSTAGSALTALTTSWMRDIAPKREERPEQENYRRKRCHLSMALVVILLILLFYLGSDGSLIHLLYQVAGYTYGPLLALFLFGLFTPYRLCEERVWIPCLVAPLCCLVGGWLLREFLAYTIGYEMILYNTLLTLGGLYLIRR